MVTKAKTNRATPKKGTASIEKSAKALQALINADHSANNVKMAAYAKADKAQSAYKLSMVALERAQNKSKSAHEDARKYIEKLEKQGILKAVLRRVKFKSDSQEWGLVG